MSETICQCGRPTTGAWLCEDCAKTFDHSLINVGIYSHDLDTVLTRRARYGTTGFTKSTTGKVQPLVLDMRWADKAGRGSQLTFDVNATIVAWCRTVMDEQLELTGPTCPMCLHVSCAQIRRRRHPADNISSMVHYLARQRGHILSQQWVPAMFDELLDLERRLGHMIDRPADRWYAGRCSVIITGGDEECDAELFAREDRGHIDCPKCGIRHDVSERRTVLLKEAKAYLVTATEAAAALMAWTDYDGTENKLVDRIRKWRDRDRLEVADVTSLHGRDRHLYRLGDIQDLLVETAQRQQTQSLTA